MLKLFEVFLTDDADPEALLTDDVKKETNAQLMTYAEAKAVGFDGLPDPGDVPMRLIAVNIRDERWIFRVLEAHAGVKNFRVHDVG